MPMFVTRIRQFLTSEDGPTAVEYAVLVGLIVVGIVAAVSALATSMSGTFSTVSSTLSSARDRRREAQLAEPAVQVLRAFSSHPLLTMRRGEG